MTKLASAVLPLTVLTACLGTQRPAAFVIGEPEADLGYVALTHTVNGVGGAYSVTLADEEGAEREIMLVSGPPPSSENRSLPASARLPVSPGLEWTTDVVKLRPGTYRLSSMMVRRPLDHPGRVPFSGDSFVVERGRILFLRRLLATTTESPEKVYSLVGWVTIVEFKIEEIATTAREADALVRSAFPQLASLPIDCLACIDRGPPRPESASARDEAKELSTELEPSRVPTP